jgi:hypothetical protein
MPTILKHTPADLFQTVAWAALTVVFLAYAIADGTIGALVVAAVLLVQTWHAWTASEQRAERESLDFAPQSL